MNVEGDLVGDFVFESGLGSRVLHCRNAPSPGATSSLAIGRMMADKAAEEFGLIGSTEWVEENLPKVVQIIMI